MTKKVPMAQLHAANVPLNAVSERVQTRRERRLRTDGHGANDADAGAARDARHETASRARHLRNILEVLLGLNQLQTADVL